MKKLLYLILAVALVSLPQAAFAKNEKSADSKKGKAVAPKAKHPLAIETDGKKIQVLVISNNYKSMTENEYVAIVLHLRSLIKAMDLSTEEGKMKMAVTLTALQNFRSFLFEKQDFDRAIFDLEWLNQKAISYYNDKLKTFTPEQIFTRFDNAVPSDEKTIREDYRRVKTPAK